MNARVPPSQVPAIIVAVSGTYAFVAGAITILGWIFEMDRLKDWTGSGITMKANTAICSMAAGLALLCGLFARTRPIALAFAALPTTIGLITLLQHLTGWNFGIDTLFFSEAPGARATAAPGRMGPPASASFALVGTSLILIYLGATARKWATRFAVITTSIAALSIIGYIFGANQLYQLPRLTGISLQAASITFLLGIGVICSVSDEGLCAALLRNDAGSAILRRLLLPIIFLPLIIGFLRVTGEAQGYYDSAFGTAARTLCEILFLFALLWWTAASLSRSDERLRTSEMELKASQTLAHIGSWQWDASTDAITGSPELFQIYGLDPRKRFPNFQEQRGTLYSVGSWEKLNAAAKETLATGVPYELDLPAFRAGEPIFITARCSTICDSAGKIIGLRGTVQDITDRKRAEEALRRSEERYRYLFDSMDEGFCVIEMIFDANGNPSDYRFLEYNKGFEAHTGFRSAIGRTMRELIPNHDAIWFETYGKIAMTGDPVRFENYSKSMERWFNVYAFRIGEPEERKVAVLFSDISARKRAEEALAQANAHLSTRAEQLDALVAQRTARMQETIQDLEAFSYSVAHDMRAPLRSMRGFADVLLAEFSRQLDPEARDLLVRIARSAQRLDQLTLHVLNYSKLGQQQMPLEVVVLRPLLVEIVESYPNITTFAAQIELQPDYPPIIANRAGITQVLSNLLGNALKFTQSNVPPKVRIIAEASSPDRVRLIIEDNGIGIAAEHKHRLFHIFQRLHSDTDFEGTGIGLALSKRATERMGGTIGFESEPGKGSRFWVEFKRADSTAA